MLHPDSPRSQQNETAAPSIHPKLAAAGITKEHLDGMGVGAILHQSCPDCRGDIFYTLTHEYYSDWKKGEPVAMILNCKGCKTYKFDLKPENGEVLYEKEGMANERDVIPLVEELPALPIAVAKSNDRPGPSGGDLTF